MISYWWFTLGLFIFLLILFHILYFKDSLCYNYEELWLFFIKYTMLVYFAITFIFFAHANLNGLNNINDTSEFKIEKNIKTIHNEIYSEINGEIVGNILFKYGSLKTDSGINYFVMVGDDDSGYKIETLKANKTYLFFNEDKNPKYIEFFKEINKKSRGNWIFGRFFKFDPIERVNIEKYRIELHLPSNAVEVNYNIDLK